MNNLDVDLIRQAIDKEALPRLDELEVFAAIGSTNSYLMQQPGPAPGKMRVAATDNQTAGRGRHGRTWQSPPGSGLCLSMAYTFASSPENLPALTLAIGLGVIETLRDLDVNGVQLKWPNDLIVIDGKLGGILTEAQSGPGGAMTVVSGIGLNIDLAERMDFGQETNGALRIVDLKSHVGQLPGRNQIAASIVSGLSRTFVDYEAGGFSLFADQWPENDWLLGRELTIDSPQQVITGIGAGIANDGALLVDTLSGGIHRVTSGSVVVAAIGERAS
ncbi:MAG: biotin--[acetyl-CoA-carboxylase] ligase [Gammaproteobacteria bacterium]|nr:biotin--[acetyl-CoA-carboxylase] ligase [Gammaproteobacteria bacterium]